MLSILCVRLTIKVKVRIPESFKVGWYPPKKTGSSHLNESEPALPLVSGYGTYSSYRLLHFRDKKGRFVSVSIWSHLFLYIMSVEEKKVDTPSQEELQEALDLMKLKRTT